jgi:hypothetical protein
VTARDDGGLSLWIYDVGRFTRSRLTLGRETADVTSLFGLWPKPGNEIYYGLQRASGTAWFAKSPDGAGQVRELPVSGFNMLTDQTRESRYLVVSQRTTARARPVIMLWRNDGVKGETINFSGTSEDESDGVLAPDDRFLAYTSTISGRREVYVRPFPTGEGRWQISLSGGDRPLWKSDGTELFFRQNNRLMSARVSTSGPFSAASPQPLFDGALASYAVARDGQRFLTVETEQELAQPVVRVVENWLSDFRRMRQGAKR